MWVTEGEKNNPGAGVLLADTGQLPLGTVSFTVLIFSDAGGAVILAQRNAANNGDVHSMKIQLGSAIWFTVPLILALNERLRVTTDAAISGNVQVSILSA